jgi:hypothetical protein
MDARDDLPAQAWETLHGYQDAARYLAPLDGRPDADHPLRAAPAVTRRSASGAPDADSVRTYLRHSCDLTLRGGAAAAVTYPLAACALAEHYLVRRVGGSGAAAASAAAVAAAEVGRTAVRNKGPGDDSAPGMSGRAVSGDRLVPPGYAGLAQAVGWLAGDDRTTGPSGSRLARLLQPSRRMRGPFRLVCALLGAPSGGRGRARRSVAVLAALAAAPTGAARAAVALVWAGVVLGWAGLTVALLRSPTVEPWVVAFATPALLVTVVLAGLAATVLAGVLAVRDALTTDLAAEQFGLVPGVPVRDAGPTPGGLAGTVDRLAGLPDPAGQPPLATWLGDLLDDLAGLPARRGLLRDAGVELPGVDPADGRALTFGDLWLGRADRRDGDDELLRRAGADPELRVVDLRLVAGDVTWGRPVQLPPGPGWRFCVACLLGGVPARAVDQLAAASPASPGDPRCPVHGEVLRAFPDAARVPVVVAVRLAAAPAGLLRAVPLYRVDTAPDVEVRDPFGDRTGGTEGNSHGEVLSTHWFCDAGADVDLTLFDAVLPRWPTFGLAVRGGLDAPDDGDGPWVDVTASAARPRPGPAVEVRGASDLAGAVLGAWSGARDRAAAARQGERGRLGIVRRGRGGGVGPFLDGPEVLRLALRGHHAGHELRAVFTGRDGDVAVQTGMDRHRWIRMRSALRSHRDVSLVVAARLPLYSDLAATYRVPADVAEWFTPPVPAGRVDPAWADAAAALTHLRALTTDGVLDWDTDYGTPPRGDT